MLVSCRAADFFKANLAADLHPLAQQFFQRQVENGAAGFIGDAGLFGDFNGEYAVVMCHIHFAAVNGEFAQEEILFFKRCFLAAGKRKHRRAQQYADR